MESSSVGIGLGGFLTLLLVGAKSFGAAAMSDVGWVWCFAPLWGPLLVLLSIVTITGIGAVLLLIAQATFKSMRGGS